MSDKTDNIDREELQRIILEANSTWKVFSELCDKRQTAVFGLQSIWPVRNNGIVGNLAKQAVRIALAYIRSLSEAYTGAAVKYHYAVIPAKASLFSYFFQTIKNNSCDIPFSEAESVAMRGLTEILGYNFENIGCEFPYSVDFIIEYLLLERFMSNNNNLQRKLSTDIKKFSKTEGIKLSVAKERIYSALSWQLTEAYERFDTDADDEYEDVIMTAFMAFYGISEDEYYHLNSSEELSELDDISKTMLMVQVDKVLSKETAK